MRKLTLTMMLLAFASAAFADGREGRGGKWRGGGREYRGGGGHHDGRGYYSGRGYYGGDYGRSYYPAPRRGFSVGIEIRSYPRTSGCYDGYGYEVPCYDPYYEPHYIAPPTRIIVAPQPHHYHRHHGGRWDRCGRY